MNTCPPEEKLGAFADGELPELEAAAVEAHLRACAACAAEVAALRELDQLAAPAPAPEVAPEAWHATWLAIAAQIAPARRLARPASWRRRVAWAAAAAAACLALAAGALLLRGRPTVATIEPPRECIVEDLEAGPGYAASVSYSPEADVMMITVSPVSPEEG